MSRARDLADFVAGGVLSDGVITVAEINDLTATAAELNTLDGITATTSELNGVAGINTNVQTQLNLKADTSSLSTVATSGAYTDLTGTPSLGTASSLDVGTSANNIVQLNGSGQLPAVDGSALTGIQGFSYASTLAFGDY